MRAASALSGGEMSEHDWQAAQYADECERMKQVVRALEQAEHSGTPHEMVLILADECGVGEFYRKHRGEH